MIFANPSGAPELGCNECGCRWFDRMTNRCYECGAEIGWRDIAEFEAALRSFANAKRPAPESPDSGTHLIGRSLQFFSSPPP